MKRIRILIADDHALFREGLRALFSALPDIDVVGEAAEGEAAITQVDALQPDVVLMDINMPGVNGIEATRRILSRHPNLGIIMVTMLEDDASVFAAMRAGARGYVLKGAHHDEILQAIRAVATGQAVFGPARSSSPTRSSSTLARRPGISVTSTSSGLSTRRRISSRNVPTASAVEEIGYYDVTKNPAQVNIDAARAQYWVERGAQMSPTVKKLLDKAKKSA